jgi:hypothetical protein
MILEQAFLALPEFLVGSGFETYESEGTLVMAFAMAALQQLSNRGVNSPIRELRGEVGYPGASNRGADIHLKYSRLGLLTPELELYGVKDDNWLEAKFFRKGGKKQPTVGKISGAYSILRDLLRLCVFPCEPSLAQPSTKSSASRYFLHVYHGRPAEHVAFERNLNNKTREPRGWLAALHKPGRHKLAIDNLSKEPSKSFTTNIGARLTDVLASLDVTTLAIDPPAAKYALYLTRIDGFTIERPAAPGTAAIPARAAAKISVVDGLCSESTSGAWQDLQASLNVDLAK